MRFLITGVTGFLGWRTATLLAERGHDVARASPARAAPAARTPGSDLAIRARRRRRPRRARPASAGATSSCTSPACPTPPAPAQDPARAVRENAGTTANLLDGCLEHGAALIYPSTVRAALEPPPDAYGLSKRLGEEACRHHAARSAVARLTSVFGPGQVAWEGATGAIAAFARRALENRPIVIPGDPQRVRDFVYVDDVVAALEAIAAPGPLGRDAHARLRPPDAAAARRAAGPRRARAPPCRSRRRAASCRRARARAIPRRATWRV